MRTQSTGKHNKRVTCGCVPTFVVLGPLLVQPFEKPLTPLRRFTEEDVTSVKTSMGLRQFYRDSPYYMDADGDKGAAEMPGLSLCSLFNSITSFWFTRGSISTPSSSRRVFVHPSLLFLLSLLSYHSDIPSTR